MPTAVSLHPSCLHPVLDKHSTSNVEREACRICGNLDHDFQQAIDQRIESAKQLCQAQGIRFTPLREQVFRLILQSAKPIGAYDLLEQLQQLNAKVIAPPTVYRSLDFLRNEGLIHQLSTSNTFFACCQPDGQHVAAFLICQQCGDVQEFSHSPFDTVAQQVAGQVNFQIQSSVIELLGRCSACQKSATKS